MPRLPSTRPEELVRVAKKPGFVRDAAEEPGLAREDGVLVYTGKAVGDLEQAVEKQRQARSNKVRASSSR